jgi:release factor glutamine methyltransferase
LEARWILEELLSLPADEWVLSQDKEITRDQDKQMHDWLNRRSQGEPLAYILQKKEFYGLAFKVTQHVLIPRPETEHLVEEALSWLSEKNAKRIQVLELGVGSGCLGLAVAAQDPRVELFGCDVSPEALRVAKCNTDSLGLTSRVRYVLGDAVSLSLEDYGLQISGESFLVLMNPPYIDRDDPCVEESVRSFEPHLALFANDQGLACIKSWVEWVFRSFQGKEVTVLCEIGSRQREMVAQFLESRYSGAVFQFKQDYSRRDRYVIIENRRRFQT